jgi:glutaredoxin 3
MNGAQQVVMYCTGFCPFCLMADRLLAGKGVSDVTRIRVDLEPGRREEMMTRTGRYTVPQIYIGDFHIGGYDELSSLNHAGKLDALLQADSDVPHKQQAFI